MNFPLNTKQKEKTQIETQLQGYHSDQLEMLPNKAFLLIRGENAVQTNWKNLLKFNFIFKKPLFYLHN